MIFSHGSQRECPNAFGVPPFRVLQAQLSFELRRARRYEHALGVVVVSLRAPERPREVSHIGTTARTGTRVTPMVFGMLGAYLRNTLRETDILASIPAALSFAIFLPGVDRGGAAQALERLRAGFLACAGFELQGGVASFPEDGLVIEDLLDCALEASRRPQHTGAQSLPEAGYSHG